MVKEHGALGWRWGTGSLHGPVNSPGTIQALLSDVKMPNLDGLELRKTILTERPGIKILLMSGYTESPVENIPALAKPFELSVLTQRVRGLLAPAASDPA